MQYLLILSMTDNNKKAFNTLHFPKQLEWKMLEKTLQRNRNANKI